MNGLVCGFLLLAAVACASAVGDEITEQHLRGLRYFPTASCLATSCASAGSKCGWVNSNTAQYCDGSNSWCLYDHDYDWTGKCMPLRRPGEQCNFTSQCINWWLRSDVCSNNVCRNAGRRLGEDCIEDDDCFGAGLCSANKCVEPGYITPGGACGTEATDRQICGGGYACINLVCTRLGETGAPCTVNGQCRGTCADGKCWNLFVQPIGTPCRTDRDICADGLVCRTGQDNGTQVCMNPIPDIDIPCPGSGGCPSGYSCRCQGGRGFRCERDVDPNENSEERKFRDCAATVGNKWANCESISWDLNKPTCTESGASAITAVASFVLAALFFAL